MEPMIVRSMKCVAVGDGAVGKTSLLMAFCTDIFPEQYCPTVFDNFQITLTSDGMPVKLQLWDTAGQTGTDRMRKLAYPKTDIFLVCYSVVNPDSYHNVTSNWIPEIREFNSDTPILLIGTKTDLRSDRMTSKELDNMGEHIVHSRKGKKLANRIGAVKYMECSARRGHGLVEIFDEAVQAVLFPKHKLRKPCTSCILL